MEASVTFLLTTVFLQVQCAFCSGVVGHWEAGDDPSMEHQRHFPNCPLHLNIPVGNIPLGQSGGRAQQCQLDHRSVTAGEIRPCTAPERNVVPGHGVMKEHYMNELGIQTHHGPWHPKYSTVESRLRTFTDWPPDMSQTPQQLAQAGFYHIGKARLTQSAYALVSYRNVALHFAVSQF
jgi:Inhibitor of Apoptosis domain.